MTSNNNFTNTYVLKLDVKQQNPNPQVKLVQYDSAYLNIELYDNGKKMELEKGEKFVVSTEHEATGEKNTGIAKYDGKQFVVYKMRHADMKQTGAYKARFASYKDRERVTSLVFRYEVYEDFETVGKPDEVTLLQELFRDVEEVGKVSQRQGEYAEDRGDYANAAGDYANSAGDSRMLNWVPYVKTLQERSSTYPNPNNGDTLYVIDENKVYRYDGVEALDWEPIAGWDTSVIQDIYNVKEDKVVVKRITDEIKQQIKDLTIGGRNLLGGTRFDKSFSPSNSGNFSFEYDSSNKTVSISPDDNYTTDSYYTFDNLEKDFESNSFATLQFKVQANERTRLRFKIGNSTDWSDFITIEPTSTFEHYFVVASTKGLTSDRRKIYITHDEEITIKKESLKVEEASKPSTWTPSYLDVFNILEAYKLRMDNMDTRMNGIDSTISNLRSTTSQRMNGIDNSINEIKENYVRKFVVDEIRENMTHKWAEIAQNAESLKLEVGKKVGPQYVKSVINQSAETIKIKASNIDFDGAVIFKHTESNKIDPNSFISFKDGQMYGKGYYERTWRDGIVRKRNQEYGFVDGMLRISDPQGDLIDSNKYGVDYRYDRRSKDKVDFDTYRTLYYTSDGISTAKDGTGKIYNEEGRVTSSGTIEFYSHEYSKDRGLTLYSEGGAIALQATNNTIHIHSRDTNYIRSKQASVILRPHENTRGGSINEFAFGVSADLTGRMYFGNLGQGIGVGLRFIRDKNAPIIRTIVNDGSFGENVILESGMLRANKIVTRNGKYAAYWNGTGTGNTARSGTLCAGGIVTTDTNFYLAVGGELRVTNKRGWNEGKAIGYLPVRASKFLSVSSRKYKTNIKDLEIDTIDILKNTEVKQYNLKTDLDKGVNKTKYGVILEDTPEVLREGDGVDNYTMLSILWDVVKKQQAEIEKLKQK